MMPKNNTFIIADEGWKYLLGFAIAYLFFALIDADLLQLLTIIAFIMTLYLYRNPEREVPHYQRGSIVSPVDGKVTAIESLDACPGIEGACHKVTIRSGCLDASLLRVPFDATVEKLEHRHGARLGSSKVGAKALNEKATLYLSDAAGHKLEIEHLLEQSPDPISLRIAQERNVVQGRRYGSIMKGTHTLYLPESIGLSIKRGDKLLAGETLLGYFS